MHTIRSPCPHTSRGRVIESQSRVALGQLLECMGDSLVQIVPRSTRHDRVAASQ